MRKGRILYRDQYICYDLVVNDATKAAIPILLLGGVLQNRRSWNSYIRDISAVNSIMVIDLPGIGEGGILEASYGFDFLADCIKELMTHLDIPKVHIFSTSYSSIIAYEFSRRYTSLVEKLVISSSMASLPEVQRNVMRSCINALENNDIESFYRIFIEGVCHPGKHILNYDLSRKVIQKLAYLLTPVEIAQFIENTKRVLQYTIPAMETSIELSPLIFTGVYDNFTPPGLCRNIGKLYSSHHFGTIDDYDHLFHIGNRQTIIESILPFFREGKLPSFISSDLSVQKSVS